MQFEWRTEASTQVTGCASSDPTSIATTIMITAWNSPAKGSGMPNHYPRVEADIVMDPFRHRPARVPSLARRAEEIPLETVE